MMRAFTFLVFLVASAQAFAPHRAPALKPAPLARAPAAPSWLDGAKTLAPKLAAASALALAPVAPALAAAEVEYGSVAAPGWVLPVGAIIVIATAALPVVMSDGATTPCPVFRIIIEGD